MVDAWGPWVEHGAGNATRLGYTQWETVINAGLSAIHVERFIQSRYPLVDSSAVLVQSGTPAGSTPFSFSHSGSNQITSIGTVSANVEKRYGGTTAGSWSAVANGIDALPSSPSVSGSWKIAKIPYEPPRIVPWASVTRVSDSQQRLQWGHDMDPASGPQPVTAFNIYRRTNGGAASPVASLEASVSSWDDTTTAPNAQYTYEIYPFNEAGAGPGRVVGTVVTRPAAPVIGSAVKSGADIVLTFTDRSGVESSHEIEHMPGGGPSEVLKGPSGSSTTGAREWTHSAPSPSVTHAYRVRARNAAGVSEWSAWSNTVQLIAPPLAPTMTGPSGAQDSAEPVRVTWRHNPVDTTPQRAYSLRHRKQGTATWAYSGTVTTPNEFRDLNLTAGVWEVEVQTYGDHATPSPYSATLVVVVSGRPTVTVLGPSSVTSNRANVTWSFSDPEASAQVAWRVSLRRDGVVLHTESGSGAASSWMTPVLDNGSTYTVVVDGQDSAGLWSRDGSITFAVAYAAPPAPSLVSVWDETTAAVTVTALVPLGDPPAVEVEVWRAADPASIAAARAYLAGEPGAEEALEVAFAAGAALLGRVLPNGAIVDHIPALASPNVYRAVAVSAIGATMRGPWHVVETTDAGGAAFLNGGPGFGTSIRLTDNPTADVEPARAKATHAFAGRDGVVEYTKKRRSRSLSIGFTVSPWTPGSSLAEIEAFVLSMPAPVCYRDASGGFVTGGAREFVSLDGSVPYKYSGVQASASIGAQRVAYVE